MTPEQFFDFIMVEFYKKMHDLVTDNWDSDRFPSESSGNFNIGMHTFYMKHFITNLGKFYNTYNGLENEKSKSLFVHLILYRLLGHIHVKLPMNTSEHWMLRDKMKDYYAAPGPLNLNFLGYPVNLYEFDAGFGNMDGPLTIETTTFGIYWSFFSGQYFYECDGVRIMPESGDVVIDAGSCLGDNCLKFALHVGDTGHVYAFDFVDNHLKAIESNLARNPRLLPRVTVMPTALSDRFKPGALASGGDGAHGGASLLMPNMADNITQESLDHLVDTGKIPRIDFIKMDIEGYELPALKGAENSLRRFRPKLAISIYHQPSDIFLIQEYLVSLELGYRFFIDHYTIHLEETVLYAISDNKQ